MVRKFCVFLFATLAISIFSIGQKRECFTDTYLETEIKSNPDRLVKLNEIEKHTRDFQNSVSNRGVSIINIPVVVHVVYKDVNTNLSDTQIKSQINVLNEDFRRKNKDANSFWPQAADSEIEFCLASQDPSGKATNGITRTYTSSTSFPSTGDAIKFTSTGGADAWPADRYLNIWVCDITGTILGYAQFPGGKAETDGVVIDYKVFGTGPNVTQGFHLGRTATHEVGHWLNLKHIWGAADCTTDDLVSDTPQSNGPNYGCNKGHWSCGSLDMIENFMDYSNDDCMNIFTAGQKSRMQSLFSSGGFRYSIINSNGCTTPPPSNTSCGKINIDLTFDNYPQETSWEIKNENGLIVLASSKYLSSQKNSQIIIDTCLLAGCYTFTIKDAYSDGMCCSYGYGGYKVSSDAKLLFNGGAFGKSASHNFCIATQQPTCTDGIKNGSETGIDCGGPTCPVCPTCTDGIKNGKETGKDCGGPDCIACATCTDGIKNGTETGVDCGGPTCPVCPTCTDGIKNGKETGIDCGGPDCLACNSGNSTGNGNGGNTSGGSGSNNPSSGTLLASYFETGWDNWTGGLTDTERYKGAFSWEGEYSIMLRDDTGDEAAMTSQELNIKGLAAVKIEFSFYAYSMEKDEDFWLMYHDGTRWNTLKAYASEKEFFNDNFYSVTFIMEASKYNFIEKGRFRFQCDASTNADQVYIDAVKITGIPQGSRIEGGDNIVTLGHFIGENPNQNISDAEIFPNPANEFFTITSNAEIETISIIDMSGKLQSLHSIGNDHARIDITHLQPAIYLLNFQMGNKVVSKKLIKY
ncbi:MAG: T9SS type A sorting domain-containing protein [Saprospiraceae bacterium]|nr:T9SS type A sorting domain-containing protein [Saprospiraceae bacterium]